MNRVTWLVEWVVQHVIIGFTIRRTRTGWAVTPRPWLAAVQRDIEDEGR